MDELDQYVVRDGNGNLYGPAGEELLREWVREGRIIRGMAVAKAGSQGVGEGEWVEVSLHPELVAEFARLPQGGVVPGASATAGNVESLPYPPSAPVQSAPAELVYRKDDRRSVLPAVSLLAGGAGLLIAAVPCCGCLSVPLGVTALVTGGISLFRTKYQQGTRDGRGLAIAGICLGTAAILLYLVIAALWIAHGTTWHTTVHRTTTLHGL